MTKKNYYELLEVKRNATEEEIGEVHLKYLNKEDQFFWKKENTDKEKEKKLKEAVTIVAVLTKLSERKRYDEHLEKFGHDEQFKPIFNAWTDD